MASMVSNPISLTQPLEPIRPECGYGISKLFAVQIPEKQKNILRTIVQIAIKILYVFAFVLMTAAIFPLDSVFIPGIAIGASVLTSFFFKSRCESAPPIFKRLPSLLSSSKKPEKKTGVEIAPPLLSEIQEGKPVGLYCSGMNCSFNAFIHFLNSDPEAAKRLRFSFSDLPAFENFLTPLHPPSDLIEAFRHYLGAQKQPQKLTIAFKQFIAGSKTLQKEAAPFIQFAKNYNRSLMIVRSLSKLFAAYDRAIQENRSIADTNTHSLRHALSRDNFSISPSEKIQQDPAELLKIIFDLLPDSHQIAYESAVHYDINGLPPIEGLPDGIERREEKTWCFSLEIKEKQPQLQKMFHDFCHRQSENFRKEFLTANGKRGYYWPKQEELLFTKAPPVLRFHIKRFEKSSGPIVNRVLRRQVKNDTPIEIPSTFGLKLKDGTVQNYRLTSLVNCEGAALSNGHFIAGRILNGQRYIINNHKVSPVDLQTWEEQVLPQAYLLSYQLDPEPALDSL